MKKARWGRYELMRPDAIDRVLASQPIAYVPWGALEFHGAHNAVGLDGLKAHGLCMAAARRTGGVVLPPVYHAASTIQALRGLPHRRHSIEHRVSTVVHLFQDLVGELVADGFETIVVVLGHVGEPHASRLRQAARHATRRLRIPVLALAETDLVQPPRLILNHSGLGETAFMLHFQPETVALDQLRTRGPLTLQHDAVTGSDPRTATAALGRRLVREFVSAVQQQLAAVRRQPR